MTVMYHKTLGYTVAQFCAETTSYVDTSKLHASLWCTTLVDGLEPNILNHIPYSRKYWRSLNLAVWSRAAEIKILADLNLAVVPYI